jgi:hypothetical protein
MPIELPKLVEELLVVEYSKTPDEAAVLVKKHTNIIVNAIMAGLTFASVRAAAMAIDMAESGITPQSSAA